MSYCESAWLIAFNMTGSPVLCALTAGVSVRHHLLTAYTHSFLAVLLSQFSGKRFPGAMIGVTELVERCIPIQVLSTDDVSTAGHAQAMASGMWPVVCNAIHSWSRACLSTRRCACSMQNLHARPSALLPCLAKLLVFNGTS